MTQRMDLTPVKQEDGTFASVAWPGGYPLFYYDEEWDALCPTCASKEGMSTEVIAYDVNWEDARLRCDDCSRRIPSAYADEE